MALPDSFVTFPPYPWQQSFSQWNGEKVAVVSAPTGAGKESGAVVPWLYGHRCQQDVPSRLIYGLPTRSLVDQVHFNIGKLVAASGLDISVYCLKGGLIEHGYEDRIVGKAVIVGTQDQLLTRALNRGYSVPWSQRPKQESEKNWGRCNGNQPHLHITFASFGPKAATFLTTSSIHFIHSKFTSIIQKLCMFQFGLGTYCLKLS